MTITADIQTLEPGSIFTGWILDATTIGGGIVRFHAHLDGPLWWQGEEYSPWPIKAEGFELTGDQQPMPKLSVGNVDGSITAMCMALDDMLGATLTRKRTLTRYLDAVNFPGGNPDADPTEEFPPELWFIERKASETREVVEFELSSALNFQGVNLPRRLVLANNCPWQYRGPGCGYTGPPVATALDAPTSDPTQDRCGKRLASCKLRQWPDGVLNFGGFPAAGLVRI